MAHAVAAALAADVNNITRSILGDPSSITRHEIRYGRRGSLAIVRDGPKRGQWFDHESGEGGDLIGLMREQEVDFRRAVEIARDLLGERPVEKHPAPSAKSYQHPDQTALRRQAFALSQWAQRQPIHGSPGQTYLLGRGIDIGELDLDHVLGFDSEAHAMLALMTDPITGEPAGIHRIFLDQDAQKIERKMLGKQGVVRISADDEVGEALGICEGVEDALSVLVSGWRPVWAATSAGAIARFPLLPGIGFLTVFCDGDEVGRAAAKVCQRNWVSADRTVRLIIPGAANV
jgi:hypothetical protein